MQIGNSSVLENIRRAGIISFLFLIALCVNLTLLLPMARADSLSKGKESGKALLKRTDEVRSVGDLISLFTKLKVKSIEDSKVISTVEIEDPRTIFATTRVKAEEFKTKLDELKKSGFYGYDQLADFKAEVKGASDDLEKVRREVQHALGTLYDLQNYWAGEGEKWQGWQVSLKNHRQDPSVRSTFSEARGIVSGMLSRADSKLKPVLNVKQRLGEVESEIIPILSELDVMLKSVRRGIFNKSSPPMISPIYYKQLVKSSLKELKRKIQRINLLSANFFLRQGWIGALQFLLSALLIWGMIRYRLLLEESSGLSFLLHRTVSAGVFIGVSLFFSIYDNPPPLWRLFLWGLVCFTATRVVGCLISYHWKRWLVALLASLFFAIQFFRVFGLPQPLFRLYVTIVALGGFPLCLWRAKVSRERKDNPLFSAALTVGGLILFVVLMAEVGGFDALATHLLDATIKSIFLVLLSWLFVLIARGVGDLLLTHSYLNKIAIIRQNKETISRRLRFVTDLLVWVNAFLLALVAWRLFDSVPEALTTLVSYGVNIGKEKFTVGNVLAGGAVLYGSIIISSSIQTFLIHDVFPKHKMETGTAISIGRLFRYAIILVGFMFALSALGFALSNLVIITGALGVGIGFGLQNIANNFISGLILLFERPIKVGDIVQIGDEMGEIKKLGLRATVVRSFHRSEIIVPNNEMISNQVINWTLTDRMIRLAIPVGVAYGSDLPLVRQILLEIADGHPRISGNPKPEAMFIRFGDSSLNFELHAWLVEVRLIFEVRSELNMEIDRRFREEKVTIPFPQRDLHLRTGNWSSGSMAGKKPLSNLSGEDDGYGSGKGE